MKEKIFLFSIFLASLVVTYPTYAQVSDRNTGFVSAKEVTFQVTFKGKIGQMKEMGGYYLYGTPEEYRIANQNPKVLENLVKKDETVTVEGSVSRNTGFLTIEKINGKPYQGDKEPYSDS